MDATRLLVREVVLRAVRTIRDEPLGRKDPGRLSMLYERARAAYDLLPRDEQKTLWLSGVERVR